VTELIANTVIQPHLRDSIVRGDLAAIAALDKVVKPDVVQDPIVRVKLWAPDGRIVYSDEPRLIGDRYKLDPDARAAFNSTGAAPAEVSDLSRPENRFEARKQVARGLCTRHHEEGSQAPLRVVPAFQLRLCHRPPDLVRVRAGARARSHLAVARAGAARPVARTAAPRGAARP
jgi:hypothetical protein